MSVSVIELGIKLSAARISPNSASYRPPSWPPPADWVVTEDALGNPLSRYVDDSWDFSGWAGTTAKLDFAGTGNNRRSHPLSTDNQSLLKLLATWLLWGPNGAECWSTLKLRFLFLRRIFVICENNGVLASNLMRFPRVLDQVPALFRSGEKGTILVLLDRLYRSEHDIGFALLDENGIARLANVIADAEDDDVEQTAYIPPRLWTYQVTRLRECLDDFLNSKLQMEECFNFCVDAYAANCGSLEAALINFTPTSYLPFSPQQRRTGRRTGRKFYGRFEITAQRFGIDGLLQKWVQPPNRKSLDIRSFSAYLTLVQSAAHAYIGNFTLQRKEEAAEMRADCLIWEHDPMLGRIPVIRSETTKTDPDSDARWPTSPSVEMAVEAAGVVAKLRMRCAAANPKVNCSDYDKTNPYLFHAAFEPWSAAAIEWKPYSTRAQVGSYQSLLRRFPRLFDAEQLRITENDLKRARMFTPNLDKGGKFKVGEVWPWAYHQLRRTGGINMFASGLMSDSSIQVIMKHVTLFQTQYYGKNYSRLRFSEDFEGIVVAARYEVMAKQIQDLVEDRYVSPLGEQRKQEITVNLVSFKNFKALVSAGKKGEVSFRETRLGGCTKKGHCDYGGIESVARCAGGDGDKPCRDAIYDRAKQSSVQRQLDDVETRLHAAQPSSPREQALQFEVQGLRNYQNALRN